MLATLGWLAISERALALSSEIVIEIDAAAEPALDARALRRLTRLELSDVDVPPVSGGLDPALYYRVLGQASGLLRVELWERGELHGARVVSVSEGSTQLVARRVALAAAELARDLRQRRILSNRRAIRRRALALQKERERSERPREGPVALRSSLGAARGEGFSLLTSSVFGELSLRGRLRFDAGARLWVGGDDRGRARITWLEVPLGPSYRVPINPWLGLDFSAFVAPAILHVAGAEAVQDVRSVRETWTARAGASLRLQPQLTPTLRASLGFESSLLLHTVVARFPSTRQDRYRGAIFGAELGLVLTPP